MRTPTLAAAVLLSLTAAPAQSQFCPGATPYAFTDVPANDAFCNSITWMATTGVTTGCSTTGPTTRLYCPNDFVTRTAMAAFMSRLGRDVAFAKGGNSFGTLPDNTVVLGTTDANALDIRVNGSRAMRYEPNAISPNVIGGSPVNSATPGVRGATIAGGGVPLGNSDPNFSAEAPNRVTDAYGTVGGGFANLAGNDAGTTTDAPFATIAGGYNNSASGANSTVGGGYVNAASNFYSTVAGGIGNVASGNYSTIAGGLNNAAGGSGSIAAGVRAKANFDGCIVLADYSSPGSATSCFLPNEIVIRGIGGFYFWTSGIDDNSYSGARLATGTGAWAAYSDVNGKEALEPVNTAEVLERLLAMPVARWQWKAEPGNVKHIGPTAQDFRSAFGLGDSDKQIVTVDADGVALAAIQGLNAKLEARIAEQAQELAELRRAIDVLMARTATNADAALGK